ncbi:RNA polymerase subunit RPABC4/transcription elongation factor Spt4 [Aequitasia blattaphilus]|uniref:Zinc ribbon domain-containing protein n=1 Tax=Aequitasia blattaphilus TaxID=2949332 RepID=A0ABT1E8M9_9FIRM|nr:zinc ribbon domain-containing protein [Aequitasia blattaphilus]MCP1101241.1 zinc ribbon domain-containing protein [Aequitasia blattaphilus]MCR8613881.1 zinc ribbon domain-containing protein [Aequitasia blattaphilus]
MKTNQEQRKWIALVLIGVAALMFFMNWVTVHRSYREELEEAYESAAYEIEEAMEYMDMAEAFGIKISMPKLETFMKKVEKVIQKGGLSVRDGSYVLKTTDSMLGIGEKALALMDEELGSEEQKIIDDIKTYNTFYQGLCIITVLIYIVSIILLFLKKKWFGIPLIVIQGVWLITIMTLISKLNKMFRDAEFLADQHTKLLSMTFWPFLALAFVVAAAFVGRSQKSVTFSSTSIPRRFCAKCGNSLNDSAKFCNACGSSVAIMNCKQCGSELKPGYKFCKECGFPVE